MGGAGQVNFQSQRNKDRLQHTNRVDPPPTHLQNRVDHHQLSNLVLLALCNFFSHLTGSAIKMYTPGVL